MLADHEIKDDVTRLTAELVRIRSQAGVDPVGPIVDFVAGLLADRKLRPERLYDEQRRPVGVYARLPPPGRGRWRSMFAESPDRPPGPRLCLNACIDTAPTGDEASWSHPPFSGAEVRGRLYGRGAADSKVGCALFLTLAGELWGEGFPQSGTLDVLFDADEHSGRFGGVKAYIDKAGRPDAVAIGYPGNDRIITGARGFLRAVVTTFGRAEHSGRRDGEASNAILKMARVIAALGGQALPAETDSEFSFGPKLSITAISGGEGFSQIPDRCTCHVDVRLTPHFDAEAGKQVIADAIDRVEGEFRDEATPDVDPGRSTRIEWLESWPVYRLSRREPLVHALRKAASREFDHDIPTSISGASNIGNYLKKLGVPALCGFGVSYQNLHAIDEFIEVNTIVKTYRAYRAAVRDYFKDPAPGRPPRRR